MSQLSDPNRSGGPTPSGSKQRAVDSALQAGLDALKQKKYGVAIAKLKYVDLTTDRQSIQLRAKAALVKAYQENGDIDQALKCCKALVHSSNDSVREWAKQARDVLERRQGQSSKNDQLSIPPSSHNSTDMPVSTSKVDALDECQQAPKPPQKELGRSPFITDASTLVDHDELQRRQESTERYISSDNKTIESENRPDFPSDRNIDVQNPLDSNDSASSSTSSADDLTGFVPLSSNSSTSLPSSALNVSNEQNASNEYTIPRHIQSTDEIPFSTFSEKAEIQDNLDSDSEDKVAQEKASDSTHKRSHFQDLTSIQLTDGVQAQDPIEDGDMEVNPFVLEPDNQVDSPRSTNETASSSRNLVRSNLDFDDVSIQSSHRQSSEAIHRSQPEIQRDVDPELAAALNISRPRSRHHKPVAKTTNREVQFERAKQWNIIGPNRRVEFWLSYIWTIGALVALFSVQIQIALTVANPLWRRLARYVSPPRWYFLENHPTWVVIICLVIVLFLSQWILTFILERFYNAKPLLDRELERRSPETTRLLKRICKQAGFSVPKLEQLPTQVPIILSYGLLPRTSRIIVSQGLLNQLNNEEIAALYAAELGHIRQRDAALMTVMAVILQIPFLIYQISAAWGDRQRNRLFRGFALSISSIAYGFFWMARWPGFWLSRTRQFQSDRHSVNMTGNPNGLCSALIKVMNGVAQDIEHQRFTPFVLSSLNMLMPLSAQQALPLGSTYMRQVSSLSGESSTQRTSSQNLLSPLLAWDIRNPIRKWLLINTSHPLIGERINALNQYAQKMRLRPYLTLQKPVHSEKTHPGQPLWLQASPYIGPLIGMGFALILWLVGGIATLVNFDSLKWLWKDMSLFFGLIAIGFSFGILMRINGFFPDINMSKAKLEDALPDLIQDPNGTPLRCEPVVFEGRLFGCSGMSNAIGQDLMIRTSSGSLPLHLTSAVGPLGNVIINNAGLTKFLNRSVTVIGWFRRGATPWIDVETIRVNGRPMIQSSHPLWSTLVAIAAALWGAYVIYRGTI